MPDFKNLSPQTKSFLILFCIALVGTYLTTMVSRHELATGRGGYSDTYYPKNQSGQVASASDHFMPDFKPVGTSGWKTFTDTSHGLSFEYSPAWKVLPGKQKDGFYVLEVDPGASYYNMKAYISNKGFYALEGLPYVETDLGGLMALNVSNQLYGIRMGQYYYTFDNGLSTNMIDNFNTWVRTVKFQ
jgi:hypothetical protein